MSIYVGNLSYAVTEQDLKTAFAQYGAVKQVKLTIDRETGKKRGFALVEMDNDTEEAKAINKLDGGEWMGKTLTVNKANNRGNGSSGGLNRF